MCELVDAIRAEMQEEVARQTAPLPDRLLSIEEAAQHLGGIARSTVYREIGAGRLRTIKVGSRRLVPSSALVDFIEERRPGR
jgi:excisionase family DNA binding protein